MTKTKMSAKPNQTDEFLQYLFVVPPRTIATTVSAWAVKIQEASATRVGNNRRELFVRPIQIVFGGLCLLRRSWSWILYRGWATPILGRLDDRTPTGVWVSPLVLGM